MTRQPDHPRRLFAAIAAIAAIGVALIAGGCGKPPGVIFPPPKPPLLWPPTPEPPRIRYVGQLLTDEDLKPGVPFFDSVGRALFGKKPAFSMLSPYALCTDGADRLFVADSNAQFVHVFDLKTRKYQRWEPPSPYHFAQPVGIAYDPNGRLFVADSVAGVIHVFDAAGQYKGQIGRGAVLRPCGLAFDKRGRRLLVADAGAHRLVFLSTTGDLLAHLGSRGAGPGHFNYPTNVAIDSRGRIYVSDSLNFRVQQFGPDFMPTRQIGKKGDMPGYFGQPKGVAVDSADHLYVMDANFEAVQIFDPDGNLLLDFGHEGRAPGEFWLPAGIFIDPHNRIWVADVYNRRIQVFDYVTEGQK